MGIYLPFDPKKKIKKEGMTEHFEIEEGCRIRADMYWGKRRYKVIDQSDRDEYIIKNPTEFLKKKLDEHPDEELAIKILEKEFGLKIMMQN